MKKLALATIAAIALTGGATSANADVNVLTNEPGNLDGTGAYSGFLYGHQTIADFDNPIDPRFSFTFNNAALSYVRDGSLGLDPGQSAPPPVPVDPNDPFGAYDYEETNYWTVEGGGSATLTALNGNYLRGFSFYFGSPDEYNHVTFTFIGQGGATTLSGEDLWTSLPEDLTGDQSWGRRVYYGFGGDQVTSITFTSTGNSFEFDGLAGVVPEPATWAMMILGFGAAGAMIRRRKFALA